MQSTQSERRNYLKSNLHFNFSAENSTHNHKISVIKLFTDKKVANGLLLLLLLLLLLYAKISQKSRV